MPEEHMPFALVADDEPLVRLDAADILEAAGFRVHEAASVEEAVAILNVAGPQIQLLFSDVQMPPGDLTGFDLARRCARDWPKIRILIASGMISPEEGDLPEGALFINKPFSAQIVYDQLQQLLPDGQQPDALKHAVR
ncbi:response regulator [Altererythrobacter xixiisoli]|uniref:Response regulator n=1 Tax=Croceibacterium xixiisoli TaxID=1476466 RepID=A0A6I4TX38_9SPHN|nr:response regulator [Croceibacterium xixiisoli]MXP00726.1 response regulator [Croceibacterium xixiisoli]